MTNDTTPATIAPLQMLGDADAAACEGEFCAIPDHHEQAIINRRVDAGEI